MSEKMEPQLETLNSRSDERSRIVARWLAHLETCLGEDGAEWFAEELRKTGVTQEALRKEEGLDIDQLEEVVRAARRDRPDIRLRLMKSLQAPDIGIMGFAAMSTDRIDKAIEITLSYHEQTSNRYDLELTIEGDEAALRPVVKPTFFHEMLDISEDSLAGMWRLLELFLGAAMKSEFARASAHFEHAKPAYVDAYADTFKCRWQFEAERTELRFPAEWMSLPVATANPAVAELCRSMCERILGPRHDRSKTSEDITRLLLSRSGRKMLALGEAAEKMHMSQSQLRKRLYREGTSYKRIVADTRMALARHYLNTSRLTIQNIAYLLDYSEAPAFTRAFKREVGVSPQEYRLSPPPVVDDATHEAVPVRPPTHRKVDPSVI